MQLLFARHGLTDWNEEHRFQGQSDIPLNKTGAQQAAALGQRLSNEKIDHIYASDLGRAWETAQTIARHHDCPLETKPRLRELNFGEWEGLTFKQIKQRDPGALDAWLEIPTELAPPGGENLKQLTGRVQESLSLAQEKHKDERILWVAHGGPLQTLCCLALGLPPACYWQFYFSQASLSELRFYPQGAVLNLLNDTCHLSDL